MVLPSVAAALNGLCAEMIARGQTKDAAEFGFRLAFLGELKSRTCCVVPVQAVGPTANDVTAAKPERE
ncbi:hypothetical protein ACFXKR_18125 [Streptomyces violascens]|uniref:hypothetical protein n=1 Tax=Streptomyces violascens TaxID=67381 RepID=UPI00369BA39F